jgi:excinuclease ABC subunit C
MELSSTQHIPLLPGIYIFKKKQRILYIWKAKILRKRVQQYFTPGSVRKQEMVSQADHVEYNTVTSEADALMLEEQLIKQHQPPFNKLLKHNSNYVYIKITKEDFPILSIVRKKWSDRSANYIGPKASNKQLYKLIQLCRQLYKIRTKSRQRQSKGTLTTDFYLWLDAGWDVIARMRDPAAASLIEQARHQGLVIDQSYEEYVTDYQQRITTICDCLIGKSSSMLEHIHHMITTAITHEQYERCAQLRDMYHYLQTMEERYEVVLTKSYSGHITFIQLLQDFRIIVIYLLQDGKIIDIVRQHLPSTDYDLSSTILACAAEYGRQRYTTIEHDQGVLISTIYPKLTKSHTQSLMDSLQQSAQSYIQSSAIAMENLNNQQLTGLQQKYHLQYLPYRIECLDISHLAGDYQSWGISCYIEAIPYPKGYRRYKIKSLAKGRSNDYQALREVIARRMTQTPYPDLFIIDGDEVQLRAVLTKLQLIFPEQLPFDLISIGKGKARKRSAKQHLSEIVYRYNAAQNSVVATSMTYDLIDQLLVTIRDESHRFANKYRTTQMRKELNDI